ncbi:Protein disulfide isomerase-like 5-4 [Hibiscus syriacus]|uniref:Protein disulfide isomerase-like 5-4 n=1 Tax=Hibiscus syriacus TaxID=106335 RepID=A0A6A2XI73_HIBSY|nr:Protein disulfide isomerase-like 5-4 [Hibiscus syriacus]
MAGLLRGRVLLCGRLNITKTIRKFSIDQHLRPTGAEFQSGPVPHYIKHGDEVDEETVEGSVPLNGVSFDKLSHQYPILIVNFYAPWCYWSTRLLVEHKALNLGVVGLNPTRPSWEKTANIIKERYDPESDGRILLAKVDCTVEVDLCKRHHIQGYPSIRIFRKGSDLREDHGHHEHESYYGDRDTETLAMEDLVASVPQENQRLALEDKSNLTKLPAPMTGGCRIEGYVCVKKIFLTFSMYLEDLWRLYPHILHWMGVPGDLIISARSRVHSFDSSKMNMSYVISHLSSVEISPINYNDHPLFPKKPKQTFSPPPLSPQTYQNPPTPSDRSMLKKPEGAHDREKGSEEEDIASNTACPLNEESPLSRALRKSTYGIFARVLNLLERSHYPSSWCHDVVLYLLCCHNKDAPNLKLKEYRATFTQSVGLPPLTRRDEMPPNTREASTHVL